jgi:hypothetical protein
LSRLSKRWELTERSLSPSSQQVLEKLQATCANAFEPSRRKGKLGKTFKAPEATFAA